jgi:glycosyltransferase involved in cell wall biosynthesis
MVNCSIVIPVHNESESLEELFVQFWTNLGNLQRNIVEINLMENGSNDDTFIVCKKLETRFSGVVFAHEIPVPSYGEAIKQGIMSSSGNVICILECDAMDISFVSSSLKIIEENRADFVVASKQHPESCDMRPLKRRMLTYLFNQYLKIFFKFPGSDTHGLKAIRADAAKKLCNATITSGEVLQTELVLLAHRLGFKVKEVPITLKEVRNTKVALRRRLPKVINIVTELRNSLARFPEQRKKASRFF